MNETLSKTALADISLDIMARLMEIANDKDPITGLLKIPGLKKAFFDALSTPTASSLAIAVHSILEKQKLHNQEFQEKRGYFEQHVEMIGNLKTVHESAIASERINMVNLCLKKAFEAIGEDNIRRHLMNEYQAGPVGDAFRKEGAYDTAALCTKPR